MSWFFHTKLYNGQIITLSRSSWHCRPGCDWSMRELSFMIIFTEIVTKICKQRWNFFDIMYSKVKLGNTILFPKIIKYPCLQQWRTQHQPVDEVVSVVASAQVAEAGPVGADVVVDAAVAVDAGRKTRNGSQWPSWAALWKTWRSRHWKTSTCSLCPSRCVGGGQYST